MKEELRKVIFNLNDQNLTLGDMEFNDSKGVMEERHGFFHCWGNVELYNPEEGNIKLKTVAIVEEATTGRIFEVAPKCMSY